MPQAAQSSFQHPLPAHGLAATEWAMDTLFGVLKPEAWVTAVLDPLDQSHWAGGRYRVMETAFRTASKSGHYVNTTLVRAGATRRLDSLSEGGFFIFFDDVGVLKTHPHAKMDKEWLDTFGPLPTFTVETSAGNFQYFYALKAMAPMAEFRGLGNLLKNNPDTHGGFKDGAPGVRYGRLPSGINPKEGRGGFQTRLVQASGVKYTPRELIEAFCLMAALPASSSSSAASPSTGVSSTPGSGPAAPDQCPIEEIRKLLIGKDAPLTNDSRFDDRSTYMDLIIFVKGASGGDPEALDILNAWGAQRVQDPPDDPERRWHSVHDPRRGADALRLMARRMDPQNHARVEFELLLAAQGAAASSSPEDDEPASQASSQSSPPEDGVEALSRKVKGEEGLDLVRTIAGVRSVAAGFNPTPLPPAQIKDTVASRARDPYHMARTILPGFDRGEVTIIGGQSGAFKSLFALQVMMAVAYGRPDIVGFAAGDLDWRGDCILLSNEDTVDATGFRHQAIVKAHKIDETLPRYDLNIFELRLFKREKDGAIQLNPATLGKLMELHVQHPQAMIVVDTLAGAVDGGSDESNAEYQEIASLSRALAQAMNACVALVHHTRKMDTKSMGVSVAANGDALGALRGGSALGNAVRNVLFCEKPDAALTRKIGKDAARTLTCVSTIKRSHGALIGEKWLGLQVEQVWGEDVREPGIRKAVSSVALVGVPDPTVSTLSQVGGGLRVSLRKLVAVLDGGRAVRAPKRGRGKPDTVQEVLGVNDAEAKTILDGLLAGGAIAITEIRGSDGGRVSPFVTVTAQGRLALDDEDDEDDDDAYEIK